jgi:uncharacterized protein YifE (UPF0438 family)
VSREFFRLSDRGRELLRQHHAFYRALADGSRSPTTEGQRHFVAVCRGDLAAATEHEAAFLNLRKLAQLAHMTERQIAAYGFAVEVPLEDAENGPAVPVTTTPTVAPDVDLSEFEEFGEGVPRPGWFTDEGWRRMRGGYRFDSRWVGVKKGGKGARVDIRPDPPASAEAAAITAFRVRSFHRPPCR